MAFKDSKTVTLERRYDLASLFCMMARHGPAVAAATIVLFSVLAAFIIYRIKGKRRNATAENNRFGAEKKDSSVTECEPDPEEEFKEKNGLGRRELKENADSIQSPSVTSGCGTVESCHIASSGSKLKPSDTQGLLSRMGCQVGDSSHTLPGDQVAGRVPGHDTDINICGALEMNPQCVGRSLECAPSNRSEEKTLDLGNSCERNSHNVTVKRLEEFDQNKTEMEETTWVDLTDEAFTTDMILTCKRPTLETDVPPALLLDDLTRPPPYSCDRLSEETTTQDEVLQTETNTVMDCLTETQAGQSETIDDVEDNEKHTDGHLLSAKGKKNPGEQECLEYKQITIVTNSQEVTLPLSQQLPSASHHPIKSTDVNGSTSSRVYEDMTACTDHGGSLPETCDPDRQSLSQRLLQSEGEHVANEQLYQAVCDMWGDGVSAKELEDSYHSEIDSFTEQLAANLDSQEATEDEVDELSGRKKRHDGKGETCADEDGDEKTEISIMDATMDHNEWVAEENDQADPWMNSDEQQHDWTPTADAKNTRGDATDDDKPEETAVHTQACDSSRRSSSNNDPPHIVNVTFCIHYLTHSTAQTLAVTGNLQELGCWETFVPMERTVDGFWVSVPVGLPAESYVEWKFVLLEEGRVCRWEECANRCMVTGYGEDLSVHKWWGIQ